MNFATLNGATIPGFIFLAGGILVLLYILWLASMYKKVKAWPKIKGTIVELYVKHYDPSYTGRTGVNYPYTGYQYTYYKPSIKYKYHFYGKEYMATKISYGVHWTKSLSEASSYLIGLKHGEEIPVYIDPHSPNKSVLIVNDETPIKLPMLMSLLFIIGGWVEVVMVLNPS